MKISLDGRKKLRKYIEELLEKVPKGKRIHIDKEILETLLFEKLTIKKNTQKNYKLPIWSGEFLSKIDLSEIDFENVSWSLLGENEEKINEKKEQIKKYLLNQEEKTEEPKEVRNNEKKRKKTKSLLKYIKQDTKEKKQYINRFVNYSNTNAKIDFKKSIEYKVFKEIEIKYCDFSGTDLSNNEIEDYSISNSYLNNTGLKLKKFNLEKLEDTRITGLDLSKFSISIIDVLILFKNEKYNETANLKDTNIKIYYDRNHPIYTLYEIEKIAKHGKLNGCFLNEQPIINNKIEKEKKNNVQLILKKLKNTN